MTSFKQHTNIFMKYIFALLAMIATTSSAVTAQNAQQGKMLRHVVIFKFKETSSASDVKKVEDAFRALPGRIKEINAFEWGTNNSPENLAQGFTHCFFVSFKSEKDRETYLPHPAHKEFVEILKPHLDKVMVIDYWAKD